MDSRPHEGIHSARRGYCLRRTFCRGSVFHSSRRCAVSVVAEASDWSCTLPLVSAANNTSLLHRCVYNVNVIEFWYSVIGGFRDTYLGRQVVSSPGGPRAGMGSAGGLGALWALLAGSGAEPQPKSNLLPFSLKLSHQVATISITFNAMQTTNFKVKKYFASD